jgi:hypothetical protein
MEPSFLKIETYQADDLTQAGTAISRLRDNDIGAILLKDVYPKDSLAKLPVILAENTPDFITTTFPAAFCAYFYGINLNLAESDMTPYFAAEPAFRKKLAALDLGGAPAQDRICSLLSQLDESRPYGAAPGLRPNDQHFFTTLRAHLTGGYIPAHFDNEAALRPTYKHIAALCEADIYSFVLCIDQAEAGGALDVYNLTSKAAAADFRNLDGAGKKKDLSDVESSSIRLEPGEMVILHSSQYLHGVSKVQGDHTRWTMCSFMALARDGTQAYCWG